MTTNDGGPAVGMSLRDHFAGLAMASIISKTPWGQGTKKGWSKGAVLMTPKDHAEKVSRCAEGAYSYADAMLAARTGAAG